MVEQRAINDNQPIINDKYSMFEWKPGIHILDEVIKVIDKNEDKINIDDHSAGSVDEI